MKTPDNFSAVLGEVVHFLLDNGVSVNDSVLDEVRAAIRDRDPKSVRLSLEAHRSDIRWKRDRGANLALLLTAIRECHKPLLNIP